MALNLANMLADYNGTAFAVAGTGEWGFIPQAWYMAVPVGHGYPNNFDAAHLIVPFGGAGANSNETFQKANYHRLIAAGMTADGALFGTMLRWHIASRGAVVMNMAQRAVVEDEYVAVNPGGGGWANAVNDIPNNANATNIAKYIRRYGTSLMHQMVFVFLGRGHHWNPVYDEIYDRLKTACFMADAPGFALPTNEQLYRLLMHPFGIKPLFALTLLDVGNAHMAAAMYIRFMPAPPIAGCAQITTLNASLITMSKEPWWPAFAARFATEIAVIRAEVVLIMANPTMYHVAARVFGHPNRVMVTAPAMAAFERLSQFALGFIDHLHRNHSLRGQQAITQHSGGMTGLAEAFSRACDRFGRPDANVADMATFLANL